MIFLVNILRRGADACFDDIVNDSYILTHCFTRSFPLHVSITCDASYVNPIPICPIY